MTAAPRKSTSPSLKDLLDKDKDKEKDITETSKVKPAPIVDTRSSETEKRQAIPHRQTTTVADSGGLDNSNSQNISNQEFTADVANINRTQFDTSGNGVTDNRPVDYENDVPLSARGLHSVPSENATAQVTVNYTSYATESENDDKGRRHLNVNDPNYDADDDEQNKVEGVHDDLADDEDADKDKK